jgi:hypothetical protein
VQAWRSCEKRRRERSKNGRGVGKRERGEKRVGGWGKAWLLSSMQLSFVTGS